MSTAVNKLYNADGDLIWQEKCSPWNTDVERDSPIVSMCGKFIFGSIHLPGISLFDHFNVGLCRP